MLLLHGESMASMLRNFRIPVIRRLCFLPIVFYPILELLTNCKWHFYWYVNQVGVYKTNSSLV